MKMRVTAKCFSTSRVITTDRKLQEVEVWTGQKFGRGAGCKHSEVS